MSAAPRLRARALVLERRSRAGHFRLQVGELELRAGEALALLGPNGAGKSTLLRALAGLDAPAAGRVERQAPGPVTLVFQRPIMLAGSVAHNVRVALRAAGRSTAVHDALARFGIGGLAERRASTLSGGEKRRLALARAFALEPSVLLLDEPFDDLDAAAQETLSLDLRRAIDDTGVAVGVVTHDLRRALLLGDRLAVLCGGRLAQQGARDDVLAAPVDARVAGIVGMVNQVAGHVAAPGSDADCGWVRVDAQHAVPAQTSLPLGTRVCAGFRPENLKVDVGRGDGVPIGKGTVRSVVSDGVLATLTLDWAGHALRTYLLAGRGLGRNLRRGDAVLLALRPEHVHLMPPAGPDT